MIASGLCSPAQARRFGCRQNAQLNHDCRARRVGAIGELPTNEMRASRRRRALPYGEKRIRVRDRGRRPVRGRTADLFRQPSESRVRDCAAAALDRGRINAFARKLDVDPEALGRLGIGMLGLARHRPRMYGFNENLTLNWRPGRGAILFAELTGLPPQTERQCSLCRHCGASVVTAHVPS